jgi:Flp pilus assembly protein TadD
MRPKQGSINVGERREIATAVRVGLQISAILLAISCMELQALPQMAAGATEPIHELEQQANADLKNQKTALAMDEFKKILAIEPDNVQAHANLGLAYYLQADFAGASEQFETALHLKPELWDTAALCGFSEIKTGQIANAKGHLREAFNHVQDEKLRMATGQQLYSLFFEDGDLAEASGVVNVLEKLEPRNVDVLYAAHQVYSLLANRAYLSIAQSAPDSARMYQARGDKMIQSGNLKGAIAAYREAIQRDPHLVGAHFALGGALSESPVASDRAAAENEYKEALAENALDEKAECRLGAMDLDRSDVDGATQHYRHALQVQPDDPDANEGLGMVMMATNSYHEAVGYLKRAVELDPTDGVAHYHLALANRQLGDRIGANREMEEFRRLKTEKDNLRLSLKALQSPGAEPKEKSEVP